MHHLKIHIKAHYLTDNQHQSLFSIYFFPPDQKWNRFINSTATKIPFFGVVGDRYSVLFICALENRYRKCRGKGLSQSDKRRPTMEGSDDDSRGSFFGLRPALPENGE